MLSVIKSIAKQNNYEVYTKPYQLNIWGFRSAQTNANRFDDEIHVFFKKNLVQWEYHVFKATTDPGTYWLNNPMQPQGTAILAKGQYKNAYQLGLHRGQYIALTQHKSVTVIRDYNRNAKLDFFNGKKSAGLFGINIHRAMASGITRIVDKFSAGCQVFANASDFYQFIKFCERHKQLYGNQFTYTLVDWRSKAKAGIRKFALGTLAVGTVGLSTYFIINHKQKSKK